jgi:Flp pilus assembly pilin Flp
MGNRFRRFIRDDSGATAIEYSLIACLLAAAIIAAWPGFYGGFMASWTNIGAVISSAVK